MVTLQNLIDQTNDFCASYSVTTVSLGNVERGINRAIEFVQRRLGLPSDKAIQSFWFYEDTPYYNCAIGFNELIGLKYNTSANSFPIDQNPNVPRRRWNVYKDVEIMQLSGQWPDENQVAFTTVNGMSQLLLHGRNQRGAQTINPLNSASGLTYSTDISGVTVDSNVYKYSNGSLSFNINTSLSATWFNFPGIWNISSLLNTNGAYRMYVDFPTGTTGYFTNVELRLQSSAGNYYSMPATLQSDGTAWNSGSWSLLSWQLSNATIVGSPDPTKITPYVYFNHSGSYAAVTGMRINYLYQITPDLIDAIYYSAYKGTDTTGTVPKLILDTASDICSFGSIAPDLILPICLKAAATLSPQILASPEFQAIWKADFLEAMLVFGRVYPRQRASGGFGATNIRR
jgi:hypothetical protein